MSIAFGKMQIEFTASEPGSIVMVVRARVTTREELDKLVATISASRILLADATLENGIVPVPARVEEWMETTK